MVDLETLAAEVAELRDLEEIKKVKYRYFRAMTDNDHDALKGRHGGRRDVVLRREVRVRGSRSAAGLPDRIPRPGRRDHGVLDGGDAEITLERDERDRDLGHVPLLL